MRIISLITAIAVIAILYVLVFERDVLQDFSSGEKIEEIASDLGDGPELGTITEVTCYFLNFFTTWKVLKHVPFENQNIQYGDNGNCCD